MKSTALSRPLLATERRGCAGSDAVGTWVEDRAATPTDQVARNRGHLRPATIQHALLPHGDQ
jgi:hypothetical protein